MLMLVSRTYRVSCEYCVPPDEVPIVYCKSQLTSPFKALGMYGSEAFVMSPVMLRVVAPTPGGVVAPDESIQFHAAPAPIERKPTPSPLAHARTLLMLKTSLAAETVAVA